MSSTEKSQVKEQTVSRPESASGAQSNQGRWVLFATILASSMAFIDGTALNVALPTLQAGLNASGPQLLWVVNGYLLMLAALILVGGALGDNLGRKRVYMVGIELFMLASLACGFAPTIEFLIVARIAEGIGGALMIPGSLAIITAYFQSDERGRAIGTWSAVTTIVTVAGPVLGGVLANAGLWRGVFLINLPLGLATLWALYRYVPESRDQNASRKIDYLGAALVMLGLGGLTYAFISAPEIGFGDPRVYAAVGVGVMALIVFVIVEARSDHPMMPLYVFRSRTFVGTNLLTLFLYGALSVSSFFLSLDLIQVQGYNPALAGFSFTPFVILLAALSRTTGSWADRAGARLPLIIGPAITGVGFLWNGQVGLTQGPSEYWTTFFPGVVAMGIGMGITVAPLTTAVMGAVATEHAGIASGINNAVSRTAGVLALAAVGGLALVFFASALQARTAPLNLNPPARAELAAETSKLGEASVPPQVDPTTARTVENAIKLAFVDTFRTVMFASAGLAWLSAIMAAFFVRSQAGKPRQTSK